LGYGGETGEEAGEVCCYGCAGRHGTRVAVERDLEAQVEQNECLIFTRYPV
jgi:hypothetical protein